MAYDEVVTEREIAEVRAEAAMLGLLLHHRPMGFELSEDHDEAVGPLFSAEGEREALSEIVEFLKNWKGGRA